MSITEPQINVGLLLEIADKIEADPELYNQANWASFAVSVDGETRYRSTYTADDTLCGTAYCFAGWALSLNGYQPVVSEDRSGVSMYATFAAPYHRIDPLQVATRAAGLLGLHRTTANVLFDGAWRPRVGLTPSDALRALAGGASIWDVTLLGAKFSPPPGYRVALPLREVYRLAREATAA